MPADRAPWALPTESPWAPLTESELTEVSGLARRCLDHDGGLPLAADVPFLSRRYGASLARARTVRADDGALVAVVGVRRGSPRGSVIVTGLVDPRWRGRGIGSAQLDAALATVGGGGVTVETESLTEGAEELFRSRGLRLVFAEDILRFDLARGVPDEVLPAGVAVLQWTDERAARFFRVYEAAFHERPGYPGWSQEQWVAWTAADEEFRPAASVLAQTDGGADVGFVTCADGWIVQVGVLPGERGRGLGAGLVGEAVRRLAADGAREVLLDVAVDNPARGLYLRMGFASIGRRARFEPAL
jgi:mycothiol synthase